MKLQRVKDLVEKHNNKTATVEEYNELYTLVELGYNLLAALGPYHHFSCSNLAGLMGAVGSNRREKQYLNKANKVDEERESANRD